MASVGQASTKDGGHLAATAVERTKAQAEEGLLAKAADKIKEAIGG